MDELRQRIERLMSEQGRSARSLSLAIGQNSAYIQQLISGMRNKKPPSIAIMEAIAGELGVSLATLRGREAPNLTNPRQLSDAALLSRIGAEPVMDDGTVLIEEFAGSLRTGRGNLIPQNYDEMTPRRGKRQLKTEPHIFKLRVSGKCMGKTLRDGEVVWFDTWLPREPVALVLAVLDDHEAHVKRLISRDGGHWLESDDGWAAPVDEHWRVLAVAFTAQRSLLM